MSRTKIQIFDPPLCCPTGMCGPTVDPALIEIHEAATKIQKEFGDQVELTRHIFGKDVRAYLGNQLVLDLIRQKGASVLPLTLIGGDVVRSGSYPSYDELKRVLHERLKNRQGEDL